jgi:hypothetical protein
MEGIKVSFHAPLYLVSVPRSGATLLSAMLHNHKNIAMFNEPWFFHMLPKYGTLQRRRNIEMLVNDLCAAANRFGVLLNQEFKGRVLAEICKLDFPKPLDAFAIFLEFYRGHLGKRRWGVKQPLIAHNLPRLMERFPDLKVIHIVRDPRATVTHRMNKGTGSKEDLVCSLQYSRSGAQILSYMKWVHTTSEANYFELRYEDFVRNPEAWLLRVCDFLNEDYDPGMLQYHAAMNPYVPREKDGYPVATHLGVLSPVHTRDLGAWDRLLTWREKSIVERTCHREMVNHGYRPTSLDGRIGSVLFFSTVLRLQLRLLKGFFRQKILERIFHACRKAAIVLFYRD